MPENTKSENCKSKTPKTEKTETWQKGSGRTDMRRWSRSCQRMGNTKPQRPRRQKLSKDLDGDSDSNRTLRHRPIHGHNQVRGQDIRAKQPKHRPTGAINVGWALDHFPYHLTLLKIAVHRSRVLTWHTTEWGGLEPTQQK